MFKRQRTVTRWGVAAVAALTVVGASLSIATPAQAATSIMDSFEGNPYDRWIEDERQGYSIVELTNHQRARTGHKIAWLEAYPPSEHSARIHRTVSLDRPGGGPAWCYGEAWLMRSNIGLPRPENVRVTLAIRAGGPDGLRIHGSTYELTKDHEQSYGRAAFASFAYQSGPLTIDISARSGTVLVDDVAVWCIRQIH
ncbi:hypothetical protein ACTMTJ_08400 [Phytohabitans sp. LJ34]|uniref:hypothetical protein n=1 Tax=Phytohabitans sp. LJ34 TaxID=3452217 RepID=UPI003F8BE367